MIPFDSYEISPCTRTEETDRPGHFYFEVCEPDEADVWTLYGHIPGEGVMAIGDFTTREGAEEAFQRITGIPFGSHQEVVARVRVMHAGVKLLKALGVILEQADNISYHTPLWKDFWDDARAGLAEATDGKPSQPASDAHEALLMASAYIDYVKERNLELHSEADGTPSIEQAVSAAIGRAA